MGAVTPRDEEERLSCLSIQDAREAHGADPAWEEVDATGCLGGQGLRAEAEAPQPRPDREGGAQARGARAGRGARWPPRPRGSVARTRPGETLCAPDENTRPG